ncbi:hypothetical protein GCM10027280_00730 [Micromonospora polyrhachis]|uniref:Uncharacterized protein n=1 Tax=Micromonospora polyrhachis TaxID=1282883 RepID=A0A7W7WMZ2_9ACTN|nr:hypothetical protein [Micromonospora polyrhachis]MBB4957631.1 hypothetical protein [Micromonospora polyrhachis]
MATDYRLRYESAFAAHLAPGETLIEAREAKRPLGPAPEKPVRPPDPPSGTGTAVGAMAVVGVLANAADAIDNFGSGGPTDWLMRLLFGRAARGRPESVAGSWAMAVPTTYTLVVAVTDRRMLIFKLSGQDPIRAFGEPPEPVAPERLTLLWWVARTQVTGVRRRRHRLHGARLRVEFRDDSWLELTGPILLRRSGAEALRAALTG